MYDFTIWKDHVTSPSNCYTLTPNSDGTYTIAIAGTVMQQGTAQDQQHFNNIEAGVVDAHAAVNIILNALRQTQWRVDDVESWIAHHKIVEFGEAELSNTQKFPFNNSMKSIVLSTAQSGDYIVETEVVEFDGNVGEVEVSSKLSNGFKLAYTGSASYAVIDYIVIGGFEE